MTAQLTATLLGCTDSISISLKAKIRFTIWTNAAGQPLVISAGKSDVMTTIGQDGKLRSVDQMGAIPSLINLLVARINELGLDEAIRQIGGGVFCACCGQPLTDELSVMRGIGPVCWNKLQITSSTWKQIINNIAARHQSQVAA